MERYEDDARGNLKYIKANPEVCNAIRELREFRRQTQTKDINFDRFFNEVI